MTYSFYTGYIVGSSTSDILTGAKTNDRIYGDTGNDVLYGGNGSDLLMGANPNPGWLTDTLDMDELWGGSESDIFVLATAQTDLYRGSGFAIIRDYSPEDYIAVNDAMSLTFDKSYNQLGGSAPDTRIFSNGDLIAIVQDATDGLVFAAASAVTGL